MRTKRTGKRVRVRRVRARVRRVGERVRRVTAKREWKEARKKRRTRDPDHATRTLMQRQTVEMPMSTITFLSKW